MEHEIAETEGATLKEFFCTKCGQESKSFQDSRWICDDAFTRVDDVLTASAQLKSWNDVMTKLTRLFCLNRFELESGFEPDDQILERTEDYCLIKDSRGLLLIVVHDQENQNLIDKLKDATKAPTPTIKGKIIAIQFR